MESPRTHKWDGPDAEFTPESDDIPWCFVPERKLAVEDVKYLLSSNYKGTPYDPYLNHDTGVRGKYRSIGINRTGVTTVCQIRNGVPESIRGIEWVCFASTTFDALLPVYPNVKKMPAYLSNVTLDCSTDNFYWGSALIGALADHSYNTCIQHIDRYQNTVFTEGRRIVREYDAKIAETGDMSLCQKANDELAAMAKKETISTLNKVLYEASVTMKNGYNRADN